MGAQHTPQEGGEQFTNTTSPVLLQRHTPISDQHRLPFLCKSGKLSTAAKRTRKLLQQGDNSNLPRADIQPQYFLKPFLQPRTRKQKELP